MDYWRHFTQFKAGDAVVAAGHGRRSARGRVGGRRRPRGAGMKRDPTFDPTTLERHAQEAEAQAGAWEASRCGSHFIELRRLDAEWCRYWARLIRAARRPAVL